MLVVDLFIICIVLNFYINMMYVLYMCVSVELVFLFINLGCCRSDFFNLININVFIEL